MRQRSAETVVSPMGSAWGKTGHGLTPGPRRQFATRGGWLLCLLALAGAGQAATLDLTLRFMPPPLRPSPPVLVELRPLMSDELGVTQIIDGDRVQFERVAPGEYLVQAVSGGAGRPSRTGERIVTVGDGDVTTVLVLAAGGPLVQHNLAWVALTLLIALAVAAVTPTLARRVHLPDGTPMGLLPALVIWAVAFLAWRWLAPSMQPLGLRWAETATALSGALIAASVVAVLVERRSSWPETVAALVLGLLVTVICRGLAIGAMVPTASWLGIGLGLLLWTAAGGSLIALGVRRISYLVLGAWTVALVDIYAVFFGPTGQRIVSVAPADRFFVDIQTLPWPVVGSEMVHGIAGAGDFLIVAWFMAAAARFGLSRRRTYLALMAGFAVGIVTTQWLAALDLVLGLPALPFLSGAFLWVHRGQFAISNADRRQIVGFLIALMVVLALLSMAGQEWPLAPGLQQTVCAGRVA